MEKSNKITLKNSFKVLIVYPNLPLMLVPSIAIALFTRILKDQGYEVDLFETTHYMPEEDASTLNRVKYLQAREFSYKNDVGVEIKTGMIADFQRKIEDFKPDLMVFSVVEDAFLQAVKMLESVEKYNVPHVIGGVFPTSAPHLCMEYDAVKVIGLYEGEKIIVDVAEAIRLNKSMRGVRGVWYKDKDSIIQKNPLRELVDINEYLPDFSLFDESRFYRPMGGKIHKTVPIETYRGCPYSCTYCNSPTQRLGAKKEQLGQYLRRKNINSLRLEIQELVESYNPELFYFVDDSFLARPTSEITSFCEMYENFKIPFWFNTRPENCTESNLSKLAKVGAFRISFGIECGNEEFRIKVLKRNVSNAQLIEKFNIIAKSGIPFSLNVIIGFPGETRDLIMDTIEFIREVRNYDSITVSMFTPYNGTFLRKIAVNNGWLDDKNITVHTTSRSLLKMGGKYVSADELNGLMKVLPLYCFFSKNEWSKIRAAEEDNEEGEKILAEYSSKYRKEFLRETQSEEKNIFIHGGTGCKTNPKDALRLSPNRLDSQDIKILS